MDWQPGNMSGDIEDRRDDSGGGGGGGFGFGGGGIGIIGFVLLVIVSLVTGRNYVGAFLHGGTAAPTAQVQRQGPQGAVPGSVSGSVSGPNGDRDAHLISFTLDDVQKTWAGIFAEKGKTYRHAKLVLFRGSTYSGCGTARAATGPFYCPVDEKVYIDLNFWDELRKFGGSTADFAQAYVIAHELGHHVQNLVGTESRVRHLEQREPDQQNHLSVETELQADCYAGIWAHSAQARGIAQAGDINAALSAAAAVGDDHLQKMSGRAVSPESWTHGSSAQREMWFKRGFANGSTSDCNTYASGQQ